MGHGSVASDIESCARCLKTAEKQVLVAQATKEFASTRQTGYFGKRLFMCVLPWFVQDSGLCLIARAEWHTTLYLRATCLPFVTSLPRMSYTLLFCTYSCLEMNLSHLTQCPLVFCNGPTCRHDMLGGFFLRAVVLT